MRNPGGVLLRSDYDNHSLWQTLKRIDSQLEEIEGQSQSEELPDIERIRVQLSYVRSFDVVASTRAAFFHPSMLARVEGVWNSVESSLTDRINNGPGHAAYVTTAADYAESALNEMGAWPRPYGKGGEVAQMKTLFEDLLEAQRKSIEALESKHAELQTEVESYRSAVEAKRDEVITKVGEVETELGRLEGEISGDKAIVQESVAAAAAAIEEMSSGNSKSFQAWTKEREADFLASFDPLRGQLEQRLEDAEREYAELLAAKDSYTKLISAIAADEVAAKFEQEARWGRRTGIWLYVAGGALIAGAAVPLVLLLFDAAAQNTTDVRWSPIIIRFAIGVLAGSAATVAIRLGGRLINNANASKRMELELRAIGPFLANVQDPDKVDDARIELVSKAFGKTYGETSGGGKSSSHEKEDSLPISAVSQIADIVQRFTK